MPPIEGPKQPANVSEDPVSEEPVLEELVPEESVFTGQAAMPLVEDSKQPAKVSGEPVSEEPVSDKPESEKPGSEKQELVSTSRAAMPYPENDGRELNNPDAGYNRPISLNTLPGSRDGKKHTPYRLDHSEQRSIRK